MSVRVILEFHLKPGNADAVKATLKEALVDTRAYEGCEDICVVQNQDDPNMLLILEQWATRANYDAYFKWRTDTGVIAAVSELCTKPLEPKYFDFVRV